MHKIYMTQGQGVTLVKEVSTLMEALEWVKKHLGEGSFGIQYPCGTWHAWYRIDD